MFVGMHHADHENGRKCFFIQITAVSLSQIH